MSAPLFPCDVPRYVSKSAGMVEAAPGQAGYVLYSDYARLSSVKADLYAALQELADYYHGQNFGGECDHCDETPCADDCIVGRARAALRKAEGAS